MARERRELKLTPVEHLGKPLPAVRLESAETWKRSNSPRRRAVHLEIQESTRLHVPSRDEVDVRTHQPGIDSLVGATFSTQDLTEAAWGKQAAHHLNIPWGWFVLIGLLLSGSAFWSLSQIREADDLADRIVFDTRYNLAEDAKEDKEASQMIDRIEAATRIYFETTDPAVLASLSRHRERVAPLMVAYYKDKPILPNPVLSTLVLQPITLENHTNFWMHSVELHNQETHNLVIEILDSGEPKIDWEAFVCHQPMEWDTFARERPTGVAHDFRVFLEQDHFFSHEFGDATLWNCFRLTALNSDETLFGYVKASNPVSEELQKLIRQGEGQRVAAIVRLNIPAGLESRRGVVIEKLISPRWIYLEPPDT